MWHIRRQFLVGRQEWVFKVARMCFPTCFSLPKGLGRPPLPSYRKSLGTEAGCKLEFINLIVPHGHAMRTSAKIPLCSQEVRLSSNIQEPSCSPRKGKSRIQEKSSELETSLYSLQDLFWFGFFFFFFFTKPFAIYTLYIYLVRNWPKRF